MITIICVVAAGALWLTALIGLRRDRSGPRWARAATLVLLATMWPAAAALWFFWVGR
ncbi:MAG TPA: hypothetical protein VIX82_11325 [Solirubrobacteraceae bacterium]